MRPPSAQGLITLLALAATPLQGQLISLRTVPVASGDQFLVYPSERMGMGSVAIALDDRWADPFKNPAKGALTQESAFFVAPTLYGISQHNGAGRTLPLAGLISGERWFGGASMALQQIQNEGGGEVALMRPWAWDAPPRRLDESASRNLYLQGFVGLGLGEGPVSLGAGVSYAALDAMDGVDLLYQGSEGVDQHGNILDVRVGVQGRTEEDHAFELMLLFNRLDMTHDVRFIDWRWFDTVPQGELFVREQVERDETRTWGIHAGYEAPVASAGWRIGGIFTMNRKEHPHIPNYEIQNIPRDPGETWAFDMGLGLSRHLGALVFGVDVVFEPIWSNTWSVADTLTPVVGGGRLDPGDKEVENEFFFDNVHLRAGVGRETERWGAQLGLAASSYAYSLEQFDNRTRTRREQDESWLEWSPSWSGALFLEDVELRYTGRVTTGTGRPGVDFVGARAETVASGDFIVAPSGPLTLQDVRVLTHQFVVRVPIR